MDGQNNRGKFLKRAGLVILMGACAMLLSSQASAVLIDHWTDALDLQTDGTRTLKIDSGTFYGTSATDSQSGLSVMGGTRVTTLAFVTGGNISPAANAQSRVTDGSFVNTLLSYNNSSGVTSTLDSFYNAGGAGLGDLAAGGVSFMSLLLRQADQNAKITITVTDADSSASVTDTIFTSITPPGTTLFYAFASFAGIDFTAVKSVNLRLTQDNANAVDYEVDTLATGNPVPEPLTMLGMFLGLGGVGAYIRKRRMA